MTKKNTGIAALIIFTLIALCHFLHLEKNMGAAADPSLGIYRSNDSICAGKTITYYRTGSCTTNRMM